MDYGYQPERFKKLKMPWENTLLMGIELELEFKETNRNPCGCNEEECDDCWEFKNEKGKLHAVKVIDKKLKESKNDIFFYKDDGSLHNGTEFVSYPLTLTYSNRRLDFKEILHIIHNEGFRNDTSAGLHIHLSKSFLNRSDMEKIRIFFSINKQSIFNFSGRKNIRNCFSSYEEYSIYDFLYGGRKYSGKDYSLNLDTRYSTIEIRAFNSTTDYKKMKAVLHFCDAICYYLKDVSLIAVSRQDGWKHFIEWCKIKNRYEPLLSYLGV